MRAQGVVVSGGPANAADVSIAPGVARRSPDSAKTCDLESRMDQPNVSRTLRPAAAGEQAVVVVSSASTKGSVGRWPKLVVPNWLYRFFTNRLWQIRPVSDMIPVWWQGSCCTGRSAT